MPKVTVGLTPVNVPLTGGQGIALAVMSSGNVYFGYTSGVTVDDGFPLGIGISLHPRTNIWLVADAEDQDVRWESVII